MDKWDDLADRMGRLMIKEGDLIEKFILGSGKGGQKVNKTSSCVYIKHVPSGIEVKCQKTRSRDLNRMYARRELCDRMEGILFKEKSTRQQAAEKIRRQKRRRSRKSKEKMLANKKILSTKKQLRRPPSE
ncbi:MAG TPA: peptide chain release factor-like protein [Chlamydiales bacterium]|nr:peptide chain release factor-like protein [Chlamydiales bacterium]